MNYYEHRLREINELLVALKCKPDQFQTEIKELEKERISILERLKYKE